MSLGEEKYIQGSPSPFILMHGVRETARFHRGNHDLLGKKRDYHGPKMTATDERLGHLRTRIGTTPHSLSLV